jgi:predicted transcriptional regulator
VAGETAKPVAVKIDAQLKERVQRLAQARQRSPHWIMREAIKSYVESAEKAQARGEAARASRREAFYQDAMRAWEHYQRTGLHATQEEVLAWMESWGTENELPPPQCHT